MRIKLAVISGALLVVSATAYAGNFTKGYCTWGVDFVKGGVPWQGSAAQWCTNASMASTKARPIVVNNTESVGAIVVFSGPTSDGHVGIITSPGIMKSMNDMNGLNNWNIRAVKDFPKAKSPISPSCYIHYKENLK
jgi:surface antigen